MGIVGQITVIMEAALEPEIKKEKIVPIQKSMAIALLGLLGSAYEAALVLHPFILSSAIIIPDTRGLSAQKNGYPIA